MSWHSMLKPERQAGKPRRANEQGATEEPQASERGEFGMADGAVISKTKARSKTIVATTKRQDNDKRKKKAEKRSAR